MKIFRRRFTSIKDALHFSNTLMLALTVIPILVISAVYLISHQQYQKIIRNVQVADDIMQRAEVEIRDSLWYQIIGKEKEEASPIRIIYRYENELNELKQLATTTELRQTADVALRLLQTIEHYAWQIESNITNDVPVAENEILLEEIDSVNEQLSETLQEYVTKEIDLATAQSRQISRLIYFLLLVESVVVIGLLVFIHRFRKKLDREINEPIEDISRMVEKIAHGNWQARVPQLGLAEMDRLGADLNDMADQVEILFDQNTQKQKNLAVSEMKVLQAQITPHFIYNTLDAILTLAQQEETKLVEEATLALSNYFKITLNKGREWITVARELEHVRSYLDILKIRYGPILSYEICVDEIIHDQILLKMILQPLVENAMYHGIKNSRRRGLIEILGGYTDTDDGQKIFFTVSDNGIGMSDHKLAEITANLQQISDTPDAAFSLESGYGLYNVYQRLCLYFGEEARLLIDSVPNQGTTMTLLLPVINKESVI